MNSILKTFTKVADNEGIKITQLEKKIGASKGVLSRAIANNSDIQAKWVLNLVENYPQYNIDWLLTGDGPMLKTEKLEDFKNLKTKNLIPLYEDVLTIGGTSETATLDPTYHPSELIDAGDWFPGATAAIRHYGDSMEEYPSGSLLAMKEVFDRKLIAWGHNYCVETSEYRVTKKIYDNKETILAYSTNEETYKNGHLIHAPFEIPKELITRMFLILGCVTKSQSNGPVKIV